MGTKIKTSNNRPDEYKQRRKRNFIITWIFHEMKRQIEEVN
jgi:hypothetical protein